MALAAGASVTEAAQAESRKLQRHFGRFDILFFLVCTIVGVDTIATVASSRAGLDDELRTVRARGWALADEELAPGIRSVAVPVRDGDGEVRAAMNVTVHAAETSVATLVNEHLPRLMRGGGDLGGLGAVAVPPARRGARRARRTRAPRARRAHAPLVGRDVTGGDLTLWFDRGRARRAHWRTSVRIAAHRWQEASGDRKQECPWDPPTPRESRPRARCPGSWSPTFPASWPAPTPP